MTALNQPALAFEQAELAVPERQGVEPPRRRFRRVGMERVNWSTTTILVLCSLTCSCRCTSPSRWR